MCGIAGIHRRTARPVPRLNRLASELLLANEERGRHATGWMAVLDSGKVQMEKAPRPASKFVLDRKLCRRDARTVMLHNRYATVGAKHDPRNAHPVVSGSCAAVHNGTIWNHAEVFDAFGLPRKASVDSEVIPAIVEYAGWEQAATALALLRGGAATAIVNVQHPKEVILARLRDYPLVVYRTRDVVVWASTEKAIRRAWVRTYGQEPRGGTWEHVGEYQLLRVNGKITRTALPVPREERLLRTTKRPTVSAKGRRRKARKARARVPVPVATRPLQLNTAPPPQLSFDDEGFAYEVEPWMEDVVRQIMRAEGLDEQAARELVFG